MTIVAQPEVIDDRVLAELDPVRRALLDDARAEAERLRVEARAAADRAIDDARAEVDAAVARARRKATASAQVRAEEHLAAARRDAHTAVLEAQAELRRQLIERVRSASANIRDDPRYQRLVDHLVALAREQLGDDAEITHDPDGGIVASSGSLRVDYRLAALADRAVDAAAEEVAALWA